MKRLTLKKADRARTKVYAKALGITPTGLEYLSAIVAGRKMPYGNPGNCSGRLIDAGLIEERCEEVDGRFFRYAPTKAGCEIVARARKMGW